MNRYAVLVPLHAGACLVGSIACSSDAERRTAQPSGTAAPAVPSGGGAPSDDGDPGAGIAGTSDASGAVRDMNSELPLTPELMAPNAGGAPGEGEEPADEGSPPLVFERENTGTGCAEPLLPPLGQLPDIPALPDPFLSVDGTRITRRADWLCRRREVAAQVQRYEMGQKPGRPSVLSASLQGNVLSVTAGEAAGSVTLSVTINRPSGAPAGPIPAVIGVVGRTGSLPSDIFDSRGIASMAFDIQQLAGQFPGRGDQPYNRVFGAETDAGAITRASPT